MGTGLILKSLLHGSFSLMVFGWAQIVMDIQPLLAMTTGLVDLHGISHTFVGASGLTFVAAFVGKYLTESGLTYVGIEPNDRPLVISWRVAYLSAFLGCFSHVILDSVMHVDVKPFYPFSDASPLYGLLSISDTYAYSAYAGVVGAVAYIILNTLFSRKS
jgi:hypothetical protein